MKKFMLTGFGVFIVVAAAIAGFVVFFMDGLIQSTAEEKGSEILEAQVDIGSLTTSLLRQSLDLGSLEIADADNLENNLVQLSTLTVDFDIRQALNKKVVLDNLVADGIHFNKKRTTPAKPFKAARTDGKPASSGDGDGEGFGGLPDMPTGLNLKSPEDILKNENLETLKAVDETRQKINDLEKEWKTKLDKALGQDGIDKIKGRIDGIKDKAKGLKGISALGEIQNLTTEIKAIQTDIKGQIDQIKSLKSDLEQEIKRTKKLVADLKDLPKKDFDRLKKKYSLSPEGGGGLVGGLVTGPLKKKLDRAWALYRQISPHLKSDAGGAPIKKEETLEAPPSSSTPDFLIRHGKLGFHILNQEISGELRDFSDQPEIHGKPAVLSLAAGKNENFDSFTLDLVMDRTGKAPHDTLEAAVQSYKLKGLDLGGSAGIDRGDVSLKTHLDISGESDLTGNLRLDLKNVSFNYPVKAGDEFSKIAGQVLSSVDSIYIAAKLAGTLDDYSIEIESDLDKLLNRALGKLFDEKIKEFEGRLKREIAKATTGPLSETSGSLSGLLDLDKGLTGDEASYNDLLGKATKDNLLGGITESSPLEKGLKGLKLPF